jgi:lipopolysaccharide exporter
MDHRGGRQVPSLKGRLVRGAAWVVAARLVVNLIGFLSTLLLARLLTPADFGLVAIATGVLAILGAVTELSLSSALIHSKAPGEDHLNTAWTLNMARALLVGVVFAGLAWPVALFYHDPRLFPVMLLLALAAVVNGASNPRIPLMAKQLIFWQEFALGAGSKLAGFLAAAAIALIYRSYWALVVGSVVAQAANVALSYLFAPYRPRVSLAKARELWSFSGWLTLGQIVNTLNWNLDQLLIGRFLSKTDLGFYKVGGDLAAIPTREATTPFVQVLFAGFAAVREDRPRLQEAVAASQALTFAIAAPLGIGLAYVAEPVVLLVLGEKWLPAALVIQIMACLYAIQTLTLTSQPLGLALGRTKLMFQRDLLVFVTRIPFVVGGLVLGGLLGVVVGRFLAGLIHVGVNAWLIRQLAGMRVLRQLQAVWRTAASVAAMAGLLALAGPFLPAGEDPGRLALRVGFQVLLGGGAYVAVHLGLWMASGRGPGAERRIMELGRHALSRLAPASPAAH